MDVDARAFLERMDKMLKRSTDMRAYFVGVVFEQYKKIQDRRWRTQGASEGEQWAELTSKYKKRKLSMYAAFPGGGRKMMVATSTLARAALGQDTQGFVMTATPTRLTVAINPAGVQSRRDAIMSGMGGKKKKSAKASGTPYPYYAADARPYMVFSKETRNDIKLGIRDYILHNKIRRGIFS